MSPLSLSAEATDLRMMPMSTAFKKLPIEQVKDADPTRKLPIEAAKLADSDEMAKKPAENLPVKISWQIIAGLCLERGYNEPTLDRLILDGHRAKVKGML